MTAPNHADPNSGLFKNEPVMVAAVATWLVTNLGLVLEYYHVVPASHFGAISGWLTSVVSFGLYAVIGFVVRRVVTPAHKLLAAHEATAAAQAAAAATPAVVAVNLDGQTIATAVAEATAPMDGLPPVTAPAV